MGLLAAISLPAQTATTLNLSADLVRLGIASGNLVPNQPALDAGPLLESGVRYAVRNNLTRVVADAGAYYFLAPSATSSIAHAAFAGPTATPLTIDLQGADLYFARTGLVGLFVTGGTNLTLQNFTVDYVQQPYTQATITSVNAASRQLQFTVQPGWQPTSALNALFTSGVTPHVYVFRNGQPWASFVDLAAVTPYVDGSVTLAASVPAATMAGIRVGDVAVIEARVGGNGILASALTGSTLRNIKIYSGGSGIRTVRCASCLFERIEVVPRPGTDRLISTVADGFQPQQPGLNNTIRLCRSIRTCDDGFSPAVFVYGSVQSVTGARSVQVQGDAATALAASYPLPNGSNVVFERAADGAILASAVLVSQATAPAVGGVAQMSLTFDHDLPTGLQGTWLYSTDASWRGGGMLFERNTVQQQGSFRGVSVWGLTNMTMSGNYIYRASSAGIDIVHQLRVGDWIVPPSVNLTVSNNVIDGANTAGGQNNPINLAGVESRATNDRSATMPASLHQNLTLTGNVVANPGRAAVWVGGTNGAVVDNNYLFQPNDNAALALGNAWATAAQEAQPLVTDNSVNVTLGTNVVDKASRRAFVTDAAYRELAAHAPGASVRLSAWNLGNVRSPVVSLKDADGTAWTLVVTGTSTHALDVALPAGMGLGGAVITVTGAGVSFFGTLFVDSQDNVPSINATVFNVSPAAVTVPADGGAVSFLVTATAGAAYQVTTTAAFVDVGARSGTGTGTVNATFARNTGAARPAVIEIAGQPFTITQAGAADPVIVAQPQTQAVANGASPTFSVTATGAQSYQWYLNGVAIPGANASTYTVVGGTAARAGTYTVVATSGANSATSSGALLTFAGAPAISRLLNLSILTSITTEDPGFTVGTVIGGPGAAGSKPLLVRAAGPALAVFGIGAALPDPQLELFSSQGSIATNDNWAGTAALTTAFTAVGAFNYPSADSKDAALFNPGLAAGGYTVQVRGVAGATGQVIAELYDSTPAAQFTALTPRLINVSVLKQINTGEVLIAGFVISGSAPKQVLIRAVGPTLGLAPFNIGTAMSDPKLQLYSGSDVIASNDNWGTPVGAAATAVQLSTAFTAVGAFALPAGSRDAALLVTLAPGAYTAQVSAVQAGGVAIVEVYDVP